MKTCSVIIAALMVVLAASSADAAYHFNAYTFGAQGICKSAGEGAGNPDICKDLFAPPGVYIGPHIGIGTNATVFGVVAVTDGKTTKIIPLFKWMDGEGKSHCGCNGPTPSYARQEDSEESLLKSIVEAIKKK